MLRFEGAMHLLLLLLLLLLERRVDEHRNSREPRTLRGLGTP